MVASCTTSYWSWRVGVRTLRLPWSPSTPRRSCWTNSRGGQNIASGCWQALASVMGHPVFPSQCVLMRTVRTSSKKTPPGWGLRCGKGKGNWNRVTTHHIPWLTHFLDSAVQFSRPEHNMLIWHKINSQYWFTVSLFHQTSYDIPIYFCLVTNICCNCYFIFFYVWLTVHPHRISQIIQLGEQFCLNIFIYISSLHVSGTQVPIIRIKSLYLCDTGICHSGWVVSGQLVGFSIQPADQTPPIQSDKYQCRIDTVIFSWWWALGCPKHLQKRYK